MAHAIAVAVESPLLQLDREFHYLVPPGLEVVPGQRVKFPFGRNKKLLTGFVTQLLEESEFASAEIVGIVDPKPVLRADVLRFARAVADRQCVALGEILATAIPDHKPRVKLPEEDPILPAPEAPQQQIYRQALLDPGRQIIDSQMAVPAWTSKFIERAETELAQSRSTILVVPETSDAELLADLAKQRGVAVSLWLPGVKRSERFKAFHGALDRVCVVVGTRSAIYAPVANLGLVAVADDLDDSYREVGSPHTNLRELALMRAGESASILFASPYRSVEIQRLVEIGYLTEAESPVAPPRISFTEPGLRIDEASFALVRTSLSRGPLLVLLPRKGMASAAWCQSCGERQRCSCGGFIWEPKQEVFSCRACGLVHTECQACKARSFRPGRKASGRTVAELGKAFPNAAVMEATADKQPASVGRPNQILIATPGSAPRIPGGYSALLVLDPDVWLSAQSLQAEQLALRDWTEAMTLVNPEGRIVISGLGAELGQPLSLWRHREIAAQSLAEAKQLGLPPAVRCLTLTGSASVVGAALAEISDLILRTIGPISETATVTFSYNSGQELARRLRAVALAASARETASGKQRGLKIAMDDLGIA